MNIVEINQALECLLQNIDNENEAMNDYIKKNLLDIDCVNVIFSLIPNVRMNLESIGFIVDFLLNMSSNGEHYKGFIMELSEERRIDVFSNFFLKKNDMVIIFLKNRYLI